MQKMTKLIISRYRENGLLKIEIPQPEPAKVLSFQVPMSEPEPLLKDHCWACQQTFYDEESKKCAKEELRKIKRADKALRKTLKRLIEAGYVIPSPQLKAELGIK